MKVLLVNIDSKIPNLALEKLRLYYNYHLAEIYFSNGAYQRNLFEINYDKVFISVIFPKNRHIAETWLELPNVEIGGTGWDIAKKLPPEIDAVKPRINWGFTTRGCLRNCPFCFVPKKEGHISVVGNIYDIWDGISKDIVLMDNNILALPDHFKLICGQLKKENLRVDFNQGLDHRLITPEIAREILSLRHSKEIRFALDDVSLIPSADRALALLENAGLKPWKTRWYVYVSPSDTFQTVHTRMEFLRNRKQAVYVMRDRAVATSKINTALACWGNCMGAFKMGPILEVCKKSKRMASYLPVVQENLRGGK